ncbi:MAG: class II aldolase/adducin family protein [Bacteroidetes bacterium]|nr:class II aldolase/adducin family protein [Bacteroidota bacterium]
MSYKNKKKEVAYFIRRLYAQKLTTCLGGNISFKADDNNVLITPSQLDKAILKSNQIGVVTIEGENLTPKYKLSMETGMHLSIYKKRKDVKAIIHAHSTFATSFAAMQKDINNNLTGETRAIIGNIVAAPYALMGSEELAKIVSDKSVDANVILMENHGIIAFGNTLLEAFNRIEVLESAAKMTIVTELMKSKKELSDKDLNVLDHFLDD